MKLNKIMLTAGLAALIALQTSCRENEYGEVDLTMPDDETPSYEPIEAQYTYNHPCAMWSQNDFDEVKNLLEGSAPVEVQEAYQQLCNSRFASASYQPSPTEWIVRGDDTGTYIDDGDPDKHTENYGNAMRDAAAAYQLALRWKLSGDDQYAATAVNILNQWAATCKGITSNDANQVLAAGAQGYTFANAAEILRSYTGWNESDFTVFCDWMVDVFASKNKDFLDTHTGNNVCALHYWSNWDLVNMCSYLAIGILTENDEMVNYVVNYFYQGAGNGCINNLIQGTFTDPLGTGEQICQNQESGRDQGHAEMSTMVAANLAQMAYTLYSQGNNTVTQLDFFAAGDNALLKMGEYVALCNLKDGQDNANNDGAWLVTVEQMPFNRYEYCVDCSCRDKNHSQIHETACFVKINDKGEDESGRGGVRPGWEIYLNHYKRVKGLSSGFAYVKQFADKLRPECGAGDSRYGTNSGAFDQLGWGTLMLYRGE